MDSACSTKKQKTIVHLDVDAFYVACERELRPELRNRPLAVSQYNPYGDLRDQRMEDPRVLYDGKRHPNKRHPNVNGSLIAVSYEARARNVKRNDRGLEAVKKCSELTIVQVPVLHGKANLSIYRDASERLMTGLSAFVRQSAMEVFQELDTGTNTSNSSYRVSEKSIPLEKASIDEIYIDISVPIQKIYEVCTENQWWGNLYQILTREGSASTHTTIGGLETRQSAIAANSLSKDDIRRGSSLQVLDSEGAMGEEDEAGKAWWGREFPAAWGEEEIALAIGALITLKARQAIVTRYDGIFTLSAGISTNKTMSKLASGLKKPNRQTLVNPNDETTLQKLFHPLPIGRIRGLGGKLGERIEETLRIKTVGDLKKIPLARLRDEFGQKQAQFLFRIAQGICEEEVTERTKPKCVGAGKTFQGVLSIHSSDHGKLEKWIGNLVSDIIDRIQGDTTRYAKTLVCWLNLSPLGGDKKERRRASQSAPLPRSANAEKYTSIALKLAKDILKNANLKDSAIVGMSVTATNFVSIAQGSNSILDAFQRGSSADSSRAPRTTTSLKNPYASNARRRVQGSASRQTKAPHRSIETFVKVPQSEKQCSDNSAIGTKTQVSQAERPQLSQNKAPSPELLESTATNETKLAEDKLGLCDNTQVSSDLEGMKAVQRQISGEVEGVATSVVTQSTRKVVQEVCQSGILEENNGWERDAEDPDMEYAKQLQASFDRENEVITTMEKRQPISKSKNSVVRVKREGKRRKLGLGARPISTFFGKRN